MIEAIESFLKGEQPYQMGCSLFLSITTNKQFALRLMATQSEAHEKMLHAELTNYIQSQPGYWESFVSEAQSTLVHEKVITPEPIYYQPAPKKEFNSVKESIENERKDLYRERGHLHGRLHEARTDEERFKIAGEILKLRQKINKINNELKQIYAGEVPVDYLRESLSAEQYKEIENLKKYIRRTTNELKTETNISKRTALENKIQQYQTKLSKYAQ